MTESERRESWWTAPHVTSALVAVLTVAITTIATYYSQALQRRSERAFARQDVRLGRTREGMMLAYDLLANVLKGTEDRLKLAGNAYGPLPDTMSEALVAETNAIDARWRRERETTQANIYMYFGDSKAAVSGWLDTRTKVQAYADCVERVYLKYLTTQAPANACAGEQHAAQSAFVAFRDTLIATYQRNGGT